MGEFTGDSSPATDIKNDGVNTQGQDKEIKGYPTDVEGVVADDCVRHGKDEFPCFNVSNKDFFQNMQSGRKRLRFQSGTNVQKYMQNTKYSRKFYIKYTDEDGKSLVRPIK